MALVTVSRLYGVSSSQTALAKRTATAHLVIAIEEGVDYWWRPRDPLLDDPRVGVQPPLHMLSTACGKRILGSVEPTYQVPLYIGQNWKPTLQQRVPCMRCAKTRSKGEHFITVGRCYPSAEGSLFG